MKTIYMLKIAHIRTYSHEIYSQELPQERTPTHPFFKTSQSRKLR